jgi:hypothetical protein
MSKNDSTVQKADAISLDDEEGVKQVLVNSAKTPGKRHIFMTARTIAAGRMVRLSK